MPYFYSDGTRLYYEVTGSGAPVVFVHEFAGDFNSWQPQIEYFAGSCLAIRLNARGYPPSDVPDNPAHYSQNQAAADILALLDHLELPAAHLVGLSMGGFSVLHLARRISLRVLSLVVAGCGYGAAPWVQTQFRNEVESFAVSLESVGMAAFAYDYALGPFREPLLRKRPGEWSVFRERFAQHSPLGTIMTLRHIMAARPSLWDFSSEFAHLKIPTLLVAGDADTPSLEATYFLHRVLPKSQLCILPDCGHTINLEEPELFNAIIRAFHSRVSSSHT